MATPIAAKNRIIRALAMLFPVPRMVRKPTTKIIIEAKPSTLLKAVKNKIMPPIKAAINTGIMIIQKRHF